MAVGYAKRIEALDAALEHERNERLRFEEAHHMNLYQDAEETAARIKAAEQAGEENAEDWHPGTVDKDDIADLTESWFQEGWLASNKYHDIRTK